MDEKSMRHYLVMEYCWKGDLDHMIKYIIFI